MFIRKVLELHLAVYMEIHRISAFDWSFHHLRYILNPGFNLLVNQIWMNSEFVSEAQKETPLEISTRKGFYMIKLAGVENIVVLKKLRTTIKNVLCLGHRDDIKRLINK